MLFHQLSNAVEMAQIHLVLACFFHLFPAPPLAQFPGFVQSDIKFTGGEIGQVFSVEGINES